MNYEISPDIGFSFPLKLIHFPFYSLHILLTDGLTSATNLNLSFPLFSSSLLSSLPLSSPFLSFPLIFSFILSFFLLSPQLFSCPILFSTILFYSLLFSTLLFTTLLFSPILSYPPFYFFSISTVISTCCQWCMISIQL